MRIPGALLVLSLALPASPQDRADLKRARAALRTGDYVAAQRLYDKLSSARPDRWSLRAGLVETLRARGNYEEAARACRSFLETRPGFRSARVALAEVDLDRGRPEAALEGVKDLLDDVRARTAAARALVELDRIDDAVRTAEPLIEIHNRDRDDFLKAELFAVARGLALYGAYAGDAEVTKQVVQGVLPNLLRSDPADAEIRAFLGERFLEKYNRAAAAEAFGRALQANSRCVSALVGQAQLLLGAGDSVTADQLCARALEVNPAAEDAHLLRSRIALLERDYAAASAAIKAGLAARPDSVRLIAIRAALRFIRDDADYEADVRRALERRPRTPLPYWEIARALIASGRRQFTTAQGFFRKALERNPRLPSLLIEYGMNCLRVGDEETGLKLLKEANRKDPFHVRVNNLVNLFEDFESKFDLLTPRHYRVRMDRTERRWMEPHVIAVLDRAWTEMSRRYGFSPPEPVLVELFTRHSDFSVRTAGVPDLGALGACFGRVVTSLSPRARDREALPPFRWSAVLWHEMGHVFSLELSKYRVPTWLTEGLATYEESLGFPGGRKDADLRILMARHQDLLRGVGGLESGRARGDRVLTVYLQGAEICAFMAERHGFESIVKLLRAYGAKQDTEEAFREVFGRTIEAFDKEFFAWLDARLAAFKYRRPSLVPTAALQAEATADPKDAEKNARLAHALLAGGDAREAERVARRALESHPDHPDANAALGRALFDQRRDEEALLPLGKGTDDVQNWDTLGRALARLKRWGEAATAFRKAAGCFPGYLPDSPWLRLNEVLLELKDYEGATRAFSELVAADPHDFHNRLKLARLYEERGAFDRMNAVLEEAASLEVRHLDLLDLHATAYRGLRRYAEATERTLAAIALLETREGDDLAARKADRFCAVGEDWLARDRKDKAREYARQALRLVSGLERARALHDAARE